MIIPSVGQFVVERSFFGYGVHEVSAVKENTAQYRRDGDRFGRIRFGDIVFAGTEEDARYLSERLRSSAGMHHDEVRKSAERRTKRDAEFIAAAVARITP